MRRLAVALSLLALALVAVPAASATPFGAADCDWGVELGGKCTGFDGRPFCGQGSIYANDVHVADYRWAICLPP